jgi:hypothetical protein
VRARWSGAPVVTGPVVLVADSQRSRLEIGLVDTEA